MQKRYIIKDISCGKYIYFSECGSQICRSSYITDAEYFGSRENALDFIKNASKGKDGIFQIIRIYKV